MKKSEKEWQREELPQKNTEYFYSNLQGTWMIVDSFLFKIERAFICNYKEHWFTVRKIGKQWFNLNSLLTGPELISDTYLALFLAQLQQEGYSIFVVRGELPECDADEILKSLRVVQRDRPKLIGEDANQRTEIGQRVQSNDWERAIDMSKSITNVLDEDDENLQRALTLSRQHMETEDEEADLRRAIHLSMQGFKQGTENSEMTSSWNDVAQSSRTNQTETPTAEELRRHRQAYFERKQQVQSQVSDHPEEKSCSTLKTNSADMTEQEPPQADVLKLLEADATDDSKGEGS
ncbi:ataxin-3 isoform X3 [Stegostoma tigrinum]|uniref:ataxin-3 isoform X3 n=1 Tax=Stegostoma tigrinum TaxID=3053191 RepID=UPI0028706C50|nr:ataxin-3 isoform X3 [Stegostoma tigrinum]XP_059505053.1 ataxin-3 isoform X3 [Stegostoma tigrinum]XP_059505054.1 ataxin-3 isoform X3 [Stegostoma tigrinum]